MTLTYYFGRDEEDDFEYEVDLDDYLYDIKRDPKKVLELVKEVYEEDTELQKWYKEEFGIDSSDKIEVDSDEGKDVAYAALSDTDEKIIYDLRKDEIDDYFRDDAYEAYEDAVAYNKDPLGYYGMSIHDFI